MRCIFCKKDSTFSKSVEHIVPESLGNTDHVLAPGIVCDKCNSYFASKVEQPFQEIPLIKSQRFAHAIANKRGKIPPVSGLLSPGILATLQRKVEGAKNETMIEISEEDFTKLAKIDRGRLIIPIHRSLEMTSTVSRFIAKVAIEALAMRLIQNGLHTDYVCDEENLHLLREHARLGYPPLWSVHFRSAYPPGHTFVRADNIEEQILHEFDFLLHEEEIYFILILFGFEFCINMGQPSIHGYIDWLRENENRSPLYPKGKM